MLIQLKTVFSFCYYKLHFQSAPKDLAEVCDKVMKYGKKYDTKIEVTPNTLFPEVNHQFSKSEIRYHCNLNIFSTVKGSQ